MRRLSQTFAPLASPRISPGWLRLFTTYSGHLLRRHFHALRLASNGLPTPASSRPLVIFLNHASWWDPLVCLQLARAFFPYHRSFAPIDAAMLARYRFFRRLGFFGVDRASIGGTRRFLRLAQSLLAQPTHALWLTPQGRFADIRERPLQLQNGLGALALRSPEAVFLPLALEYTFWQETRPEILATFGQPIIPSGETPRSAAAWSERFRSVLEASADELAQRSQRRDPNEWTILGRRTAGVNLPYDAWRWLRARVERGEDSREHPAGVA